MDTLERRHIEVPHYTYRVAWSVDDDEFVATVVEFPPSPGWHLPRSRHSKDSRPFSRTSSPICRNAMRTCRSPISERSYFGKLDLRLGEKRHRDIAIRAAEENSSINEWVVRKLMADC